MIPFITGTKVALKTNINRIGEIIERHTRYLPYLDGFKDYYYLVKWSTSRSSYCDHEALILIEENINNSNSKRISMRNFNKGDRVRLVHDRGKTPFKIRNINGDVYTLENLEGYYAGDYESDSIIDYYSNYDPSNGNRLVEGYKPEKPKTIKLLTKRKLLKVNQND